MWVYWRKHDGAWTPFTFQLKAGAQQWHAHDARYGCSVGPIVRVDVPVPAAPLAAEGKEKE